MKKKQVTIYICKECGEEDENKQYMESHELVCREDCDCQSFDYEIKDCELVKCCVDCDDEVGRIDISGKLENIWNQFSKEGK